MTADTPVLDTLADITVASVKHNSLAPRELMLARIAALIALDAPPASYLANAGAAAGQRGHRRRSSGRHDRGCPGSGHGPGGLGRREDPPGAGHRDRCSRGRDGRRQRRRAVEQPGPASDHASGSDPRHWITACLVTPAGILSQRRGVLILRNLRKTLSGWDFEHVPNSHPSAWPCPIPTGSPRGIRPAGDAGSSTRV